MRFDAFIGSRPRVERLRTKLREGRFPHGLIFSGPQGVGKRTLALMLAKALNCAEGGPGEFCDACSQCRKIDAGSHPDVVSIGLAEDSMEIKIAQIRDLLQTLDLRPLEGVNKVFIIDPANAMKPAAANALLKGLEEPPENSYFILLTTNFEELLVTIRSRSQHYRFTPLRLDQMNELGAEDLALRWARGSIGNLKTVDLPQLRERRETALRFLETAVRSGEEEFRTLVSVSADLARSKADFGTHLDTIAVLLGDLLYLYEDLPARMVNTDLRDRLARLTRDVPIAQFIRIAEFLRTVEAQADRYVNRQMLTDVLALTSNVALGKIENDNPGKSR